jgi:Brp/Blh family beta-carotene 15,15'-monooxygenase
VLVPESYFIIGLAINIVTLVALGIYYSSKLIEFKNRVLLETFYLLVFTVIFRVSSLIWGFAIYFIIWHSIPSIINQIKYLNGEFNKKNFWKYIKSAFVYWLISLIGIATLYLLFKDIKIFNALFFSFLAAITFPHVLVIFILFKKK